MGTELDAQNNGEEHQQIDSGKPLRDIVICCTSISPNRRTDLESKIQNLGGVHKYDLTSDVTHLLVGQYDTPKYRHVAQQRPDIKAMDARWIDAISDLWMNDEEIDFAALEKHWQLLPLETCGPDSDSDERGHLICSITGFHDPDERNRIISVIRTNGGVYTADLDRKVVTHLIVYEPDGKKYKAALTWGIPTVSLAWLDQSIERGMILDEKYFDPRLNPADQGVGAWIRPEQRRASLVGKRSRSAVEQGQRKLRKTASLKLTSQRDNLWGDILGKQASDAASTASTSRAASSERVEVPESGVDLAAKHAPSSDMNAGIFSTCVFCMSGFEPWKSKVLADTIASLGGQTCANLTELASKNDVNTYNRFLVVPQTSPAETHPHIPPGVAHLIEVVTEFFVEKCLHNKKLCDPSDQVLGRPFPRFPIKGFEGVSICTAGFTGIDLLHVEKTVTQLGAKYAPRLNDSTSVLVCKTLHDTRKEKLRYALENDIPVVSIDWLWNCVSTGYNVPVQTAMFPELRQNSELMPKRVIVEEKRSAMQRTRSEPVPKTRLQNTTKSISRSGLGYEMDFDSDKSNSGPSHEKSAGLQRSVESTHFETAKTRQPPDGFGSGTVPGPLSNASKNSLNKSPSPQKTAQPPMRAASFAPDDGFATAGDQTPRQEGETSEPAEEQIQDDIPKQDAPADERTAENIEAERKRKQEEQTAAERAAIAARVTSLFQARTTTGAGAAVGVAGSGAHGAGNDDPSREDAAGDASASASASGSAANPSGSGGPVGGGGVKPQRRKRGIFGRATSNVSAASSASHDQEGSEQLKARSRQQQQGGGGGSGGGSGGDEFLRTRSNGVLLGLGQDSAGAKDEAPPPATQIGYGDPEAARTKADLIKRMLAEEGGGESAPVSSVVGKSRGSRVVRKKGF